MGILALLRRLAFVVAVQCGLASALHGRRSKRFTAKSTNCRRSSGKSGLKTARARKAAFKFYGISNAALLAPTRRIHEKVSVHQG